MRFKKDWLRQDRVGRGPREGPARLEPGARSGAAALALILLPPQRRPSLGGPRWGSPVPLHVPHPRASLTAKKILSTNQAPGPEERGRAGDAQRLRRRRGLTLICGTRNEGLPRCCEPEGTLWPLQKRQEDPSSRITSLTPPSAPFSAPPRL